jgi:hypothetical protein
MEQIAWRFAFVATTSHVMLLIPVLRYVKLTLEMSIIPYIYIFPLLFAFPFIIYGLWDMNITNVSYIDELLLSFLINQQKLAKLNIDEQNEKFQELVKVNDITLESIKYLAYIRLFTKINANILKDEILALKQRASGKKLTILSTSSELEINDNLEFFNNYKIHLENEEYMCDEEIKNKKQIMKYYNDYKITLLDKYKLIAYYDERFEELNTEKKYNIYHIVLENDNKYGNYGIYANGILAESTSEVSLLKFPNYEPINTIKTIKKTKEEPNAIEMKIKKYLKEKEKERKKETQLVKKMNEIENILIEEANNTNTSKNVTYKRMMKLYNSRENQSRKHSIRI